MSESQSKGNVGIVSELYRAYNDGDHDRAREFLADDVEWTNAFGTVHGPDAVVEASFLEGDDRTYVIDVDEYLDAGDTVVAFGSFDVTAADGATHEIELVHRFDLSDGEIVRFRGYPDSRKLEPFMGPEAAATDLMTAENAAVVGEHDLDFVDEAYAEDVVVHMIRAGDDDPVGSRDDVKTVYRDWLDAFPDLEIEVHATVAQDDVVMQYFTFHGTHDGEFRGIEPTGTEIAVNGFHMRRIEDGAVVEMASVASMADLIQQLELEYPLSA
ncbi:nuclear transport factor 2 family protein [Halorubellus salinus]|uniref:nuclear transport factor 2 family protein n=1 Tax=Halorubellus salinus TaxID=755309 RepID=UPI001D06443A|nr:nuclear transport factor 2 family protein [Halorubellus salinus]